MWWRQECKIIIINNINTPRCTINTPLIQKEITENASYNFLIYNREFFCGTILENRWGHILGLVWGSWKCVRKEMWEYHVPLDPFLCFIRSCAQGNTWCRWPRIHPLYHICCPPMKIHSQFVFCWCIPLHAGIIILTKYYQTKNVNNNVKLSGAGVDDRLHQLTLTFWVNMWFILLLYNRLYSTPLEKRVGATRTF